MTSSAADKLDYFVFNGTTVLIPLLQQPNSAP